MNIQPSYNDMAIQCSIMDIVWVYYVHILDFTALCISSLLLHLLSACILYIIIYIYNIYILYMYIGQSSWLYLIMMHVFVSKLTILECILF